MVKTQQAGEPVSSGGTSNSKKRGVSPFVVQRSRCPGIVRPWAAPGQQAKTRTMNPPESPGPLAGSPGPANPVRAALFSENPEKWYKKVQKGTKEYNFGWHASQQRGESIDYGTPH